MAYVTTLFLGFIWGALIEWTVHRYILHHLAKKKRFSFHQEHHAIAAREGGRDHDYDVKFWRSTARLKEIAGLLGLALLHLPFAFFLPGFYVGNLIYTVAYYFIHRKAHMDVDWGWRWTPWHMSHHMISGRHNYGIVVPIWDWVLGTQLVKRPK